MMMQKKYCDPTDEEDKINSSNEVVTVFARYQLG